MSSAPSAKSEIKSVTPGKDTNNADELINVHTLSSSVVEPFKPVTY